jgi:serine/threonine protein kinase
MINLSDFGVSAHIKSGQKRQTFVGSPCWMAPEIMECQNNSMTGYDYKVDIWSLGITAIELTAGEAPNNDLPPMRVLMIILNSDPPTLNKYDTNWSQEFKDFINSCLQKNPT